MAPVITLTSFLNTPSPQFRGTFRSVLPPLLGLPSSEPSSTNVFGHPPPTAKFTPRKCLLQIALEYAQFSQTESFFSSCLPFVCGLSGSLTALPCRRVLTYSAPLPCRCGCGSYPFERHVAGTIFCGGAGTGVAGFVVPSVPFPHRPFVCSHSPLVRCLRVISFCAVVFGTSPNVW